MVQHTTPAPDLRDEVVVVTGGSRGIGAGAARRFAALGARVVVSGRDREALDAVVTSITSSGGRAVGITAECADQAEVDALLAGTEAAFGPATMLLAFAGGDGRPELIRNLMPNAGARSSTATSLRRTSRCEPSHSA